ncbi:MAG TPA: hypothetical protein DDW52_12650 [Planctomycetaceae bacterium]|nr:hypothetical protein [Planctomycetaceae bacterium]
MNLPDRIDKLLTALKWPAALLSCLLLIPLTWSVAKLGVRVVFDPIPLLPMALGTAAFVFLWRRYLGQSRFGRLFMIFEHELTHALFAVATLHRIVGFRASVGRGGEVRFAGTGNWLITVAPYFFPTVALLLFLLAYLMPLAAFPWQRFLLGVALGYHVVSTYRETHRDQTDITRLGSTFCWLFLPAANVAVVGLLVAFAHDPSSGIGNWFGDIIAPLRWTWARVETLWEPGLPDV